MKRELVLEEWNRFLVNVYRRVPLSAQEADELRMAFFGGAAGVLKVLAENSERPTIVADIRDELEEHARGVRPVN